jgi:hypothetical protein
VVAARGERVGQAGVDALAVMLDRCVLAVDRLAADRAPAERLDHRLVAEADSEGRDPGLGEGARRLDRDPRVRRHARPRGDHQPVRAAPDELAHVGLVVADDLDLGAELAHELDEVVGEGVVVVDDEDPHAYSQPGWLAARSMALKTASAFASDSRYS